MRNQKGQVLVGVILIMMVLLVIVPAMIQWIQQESKIAVKDQKSTTAFNLTEAGIDRGMWKLKSSTSTWADAKNGIPIAGYNFDVTYRDVAGGSYRILFTAGPAGNQVTITAEGRDAQAKETRAIQTVFQNQTIPGAVISKGIITWANAFSAHWGPIMAHSNIDITDANAAQDHFPRKYSKQVVTSVPSYPRDENGLDPPNTDLTEWWSDYQVPDLPVLNFTALRSSAAATGTLNVIGCSGMSAAFITGGKAWWGKNTCSATPKGKSHDGLRHFQNSENHPDSKKNYVWYWDDGADLIWTGGTGSAGSGIYGTVIIRGNFINQMGDNYSYTGPVPSAAYEEYAIIQKTGGKTYYDTAAKNEYPADDGLGKNRSTFQFGGETWTGGQNPPTASVTDVGIRGFLYVGGDYDMEGPMDINGAVWVVGDVAKAVGAERSIVFFDDTLDLPVLNVVLVRKSWKEITPSQTAWP